MPELSKIQVDGIDHDIKDAVARARIGDLASLNTTTQSDLVSAINEAVEMMGSPGSGSGESCGITYLESPSDNPVVLRTLASGTYVLKGKFIPYTGSTRTVSFTSSLLVNIITKTAGTHVQVFYPVNNVVQFLEITDESYERTDIELNELLARLEALENGGSSARIAEVTLLASGWEGTESPYSQVVQISGVTENSQVDLTPSIEQLAIFHNKDLALVTENEDGVVTVYALGDKPTNDYTIQVTITEVYV